MLILGKLLLLALLMFFGAADVMAATIKGIVYGRAGRPVADAQVLLRTLRGTEKKTSTDTEGRFSMLDLVPARYDLVVLAPGFQSLSVSLHIADVDGVSEVRLPMVEGGFSDEVVVSASAIDLSPNRNPSAVTIINADQLRSLQATSIADALRFVPGLSVVQTGPRGGVTSVFARGGEADFNLVMIDGVQVNDLGGGFDFANLPVGGVERIEIVRGPQSALFGSDAISSVINIITDGDNESSALDVMVEGGSFATKRVVAGGRAASKGWRISGSSSAEETDGIRRNADSGTYALMLGVGKKLQSDSEIEFQYFGNHAESGVPGPFGSDPLNLYPGLDLVSRNKLDRSVYALKYRGSLGTKFRHRIEGGIHDAHYQFLSPYGTSKSAQIRGGLRAQGEWTVSANHVLAAGVEYEKEEFKNSFVTDERMSGIPISRQNTGYFVESIQTPTPRWLFSAGIRMESIRTSGLAANSMVGRPSFSARSIWEPSPRLAVSFFMREEPSSGVWGRTILRGSVGTGMRSPDGFELAFTDNPRLNPEQTTSIDTGLEQQFSQGRARLRVTYYYSRYYDLIVTLGGAAIELSKYRSDNLANARSQGLELEGSWHFDHGLSLQSHYTWQKGSLLALRGSAMLAPSPFQVGQPLLRRPEHSGAFAILWNRNRWNGSLSGNWRSTSLDVEPNYGASGGLYGNPGYVSLNAGMQYNISSGIAFISSLNNITNRRYEESYGYPSLPRTFAAGLRWKLPFRRH